MHRRMIAVILSVFCCFGFGGCFRFNVSSDVLMDLIDDSSKVNQEVYLLENNRYIPYLVLNADSKGRILLLRKDVMPEVKCFSDYTAEYENSFVDIYLSTEYLNLFSPEIQKAMVETDIEVTSKEALYKAGEETHIIPRKAFLLSYSEVNYSEHSMATEEGDAVPCFSDDKSRIAYKNGEPCSWWLRTPYTGYDSVAWSVGGDGAKTEMRTTLKNGIRPAFYLPDNIRIQPSTEVIKGETVFVIE